MLVFPNRFLWVQGPPSGQANTNGEALHPAQVAMDRMKKIKRQLSMTLRGGRGIDKTNGAPEQIGLDESGGGGGSDLGEAPTRTAPGEPRSGRGPLSSAPGVSAN